ncbi:endolytic transglycosylase MltG [Robbsia sp. Bb-Pol-6]|uniref:Endolytic murein transglycosylase n=1 Tax=Robbsia betulipollinis TaxID=2981849 RepID=A0ABT3ZNY7_9BURK|nr:endolytic transglycosylase MltG [Robbsia betulipollinis]MCY0388117.1 endolytic transglycosylase MltG [Robbsia betulipollinis]
MSVFTHLFSRARRVVVVLVVLVLVLGAAGGGILYVWANRPMPLAQKELDVTIRPRSSLRAVALQLNQAGVPVNRLLFEVLTRFARLSTALKSGNYAFETGITPYELLLKVARGDVNQYVVTIIEGWDFARMRAEIGQNGHLKHDTAAMSDAQLMTAIGAPGLLPEGRFFPDTYLFPGATSDLDIYRRAYRAAQQRLAEFWQARSPTLPAALAQPYDVLILASLVEKETGKSAERARVAAVFVNRLRIGMPLQTDPSVVYGLGTTFSGRLRKKDLTTDTPYNTYLHNGLPPTPIALPGAAALEAATHPAASPSLYFVARGDGSSEFSSTLTDHNRAVDRYQRGK